MSWAFPRHAKSVASQPLNEPAPLEGLRWELKPDRMSEILYGFSDILGECDRMCVFSDVFQGWDALAISSPVTTGLKFLQFLRSSCSYPWGYALAHFVFPQANEWLNKDIKLQASQPTTVTCKVSCQGILCVFRRRTAKLCQATIASLSIISWECAPTWCMFAPAGQSLLLVPAIRLWLWWYDMERGSLPALRQPKNLLENAGRFPDWRVAALSDLHLNSFWVEFRNLANVTVYTVSNWSLAGHSVFCIPINRGHRAIPKCLQVQHLALRPKPWPVARFKSNMFPSFYCTTLENFW